VPNGGHYNRKTMLRKQDAWPAKKRRLERGATKLAKKREREAHRQAKKAETRETT